MPGSGCAALVSQAPGAAHRKRTLFWNARLTLAFASSLALEHVPDLVKILTAWAQPVTQKAFILGHERSLIRHRM
jgi:hypothetical protein